MAALTTLLPVFFMLALGFIARVKQWVTSQQIACANAIVFNILFPILIFSLLATAKIEINHLFIILYVLIVYIIAIIIGKISAKFVSKKYAHIIPYLLCCVEGGNVALPLYLSIVGQSSNTVIFDIAGTIMCFVIVPIIVARQVSGKDSSNKEILMNIIRNPFIIAVILGLLFNFSGLYSAILASGFGSAFQATIEQATKAIVPMILFILGYDLKIEKGTLGPILKLLIIKTVYYVLVIVGFFILFPTYMSDHIFMMAPLIYFMAPTGFGLLPMISTLFKNNEDREFASAFMSLYIIITLLIYTIVVLFIA